MQEDFWMSATDLGRDGDFYWDTTGEFLGLFDDWIEGEPTLGVENVHCGYLASGDTYRWRNGNCHSLLRFVCESVPTTKDSKSDALTVEKRNESIQFAIKNSVYEISTDKVIYSVGGL